MASAVAVAGAECVCPSKRKAEASAGEERERAIKRIDCSDSEGARKLTRLPQEEVEWILAQSREPVYPPFLELKRRNPSLVPSPEEEEDEDTMLLYQAARDCYESREEYMEFQAWVRREYRSKGFVEVDFDYFGEIAEAQAWSDQARKEAFKDTDLSSDTEDEDDPFLTLLRNLR
uniref:Uncharacterized protein n=1 Tax=Avena sativa TaxID=4498 RepID=A0ACD5X0J9_AVESA